MSIEDQAQDHVEDSAETTSAKKPYAPPTLTVVGTVEQMTQGLTGPTTDFKKTGSL